MKNNNNNLANHGTKEERKITRKSGGYITSINAFCSATTKKKKSEKNVAKFKKKK
jgi:hypothetical protein